MHPFHWMTQMNSVIHSFMTVLARNKDVRFLKIAPCASAAHSLSVTLQSRVQSWVGCPTSSPQESALEASQLFPLNTTRASRRLMQARSPLDQLSLLMFRGMGYQIAPNWAHGARLCAQSKTFSGNNYQRLAGRSLPHVRTYWRTCRNKVTVMGPRQLIML